MIPLSEERQGGEGLTSLRRKIGTGDTESEAFQARPSEWYGEGDARQFSEWEGKRKNQPCRETKMQIKGWGNGPTAQKIRNQDSSRREKF